MTVLPVDPATLVAVLTKAQPGDVLQLTKGDYGALSLFRRSGLTVRGGRDAVFRTLSVTSSTDITLEGFAVDWTPKDGDDTKTNVARVASSTGVTVRDVQMVGHLVPPGVKNALSKTDTPTPPMNSFLVGYYAGRALAIELSSKVVVEDSDISGFFSGVSTARVTDVTIRRNRIHDLRTTPIKGDGDRVTVKANVLERMTPYRYFDAALGKQNGDHFAFIHFYTPANTPIADLTIRDNLLASSGGIDALGIEIQDSYAAGYTNLIIEGNTILVGNDQGIALTPVIQGRVTNNVLLGPPGGEKPPTLVARKAPVIATGNTWADSSAKPYNSVAYPDNTYLPRVNVTQAAADAARAKALEAIAGPPVPVDPRDAQIAELQAQATALTARVTAMTSDLAVEAARVADLTDALIAARAKIDAGRAALAD